MREAPSPWHLEWLLPSVEHAARYSACSTEARGLSPNDGRCFVARVSDLFTKAVMKQKCTHR